MGVNGRHFVEYVLASGAQRVLDPGCGDGELVAQPRRRAVRRLGFTVLEMRR